MICQECGERQATLHFTKIINGEKAEFHICETCAKEKGEVLPGMNNSFSIHNLLSGLLNIEPSGEKMGRQYAGSLRCPNCGLTYSQFSSSGRFGCAVCYQTFGERLDPLFSKIHSGNVSHNGKIPHRSGTRLKIKRKLQSRKEELQKAVMNEEFELAARLRDEIRELESELSGE